MVFAKFHRYISLFTFYIVYYSVFSCAEINSGEKLHKWAYDEDFWRKIYWTTTKEPNFRWKSLTTNPFEERDHSFKNEVFDTSLILLVVALFFLIIVLTCGAVCCLNYIDRLTKRRQAPNGLNMPNSRGNGPQTHINASLLSAGNPSNLNVATDTPPAYNMVVLSDLSSPTPYFPDVKPSVSESPPPKYEEFFVQKY